MTDYETVTGETVPDDVTDVLDDPDEWPDHNRLSPDSVGVEQAMFGTLYEGFVGGNRRYVSSYGNTENPNHFDRVRRLPNGTLPTNHTHRQPQSYRDDVSVVNHDYYVEHVTTVIVVTGPNERVALDSCGGVVWWQPATYTGATVHPSEVSDHVVELAVSLADANTGIDVPDEYQRAVGGWHSSMALSEQSEQMNELASGNAPPEWGDDMFPYVVRYGDSRNVCAVNASIYANDELRDAMAEQFAGKRARPDHGGFSA